MNKIPNYSKDTRRMSYFTIYNEPPTYPHRKAIDSFWPINLLANKLDLFNSSNDLKEPNELIHRPTGPWFTAAWRLREDGSAAVRVCPRLIQIKSTADER